jgi:hypothetical protein
MRDAGRISRIFGREDVARELERIAAGLEFDRVSLIVLFGAIVIGLIAHRIVFTILRRMGNSSRSSRRGFDRTALLPAGLVAYAGGDSGHGVAGDPNVRHRHRTILDMSWANSDRRSGWVRNQPNRGGRGRAVG